MNPKQVIPIPVIAVSIVVVLAVAGFFGFRAVSGPSAQAPSAPEMYSQVQKLALKSGGDYSKLSPEDQKYLDLMSHGHGQKLLANEFERTNASKGK
jgi:hypothetical protein